MRRSPPLPRATIARARALRRDLTQAERTLQRALRAAFPLAHWRKQVPLGPYFADFASHAARLVIELDGSQHADAAEYDAERTAFLETQGYRVLRFWNNQVLGELDGVLTAIRAALPSPLVGEGAPKGRMGGARPRRAPAESPVLNANVTPPSPRVGEGAPKGRMGGADRRSARSAGALSDAGAQPSPEDAGSRPRAAMPRTPAPRPPHKGEGANSQPPVGVL